MSKPPLHERIAVWMEVEIMTRLTPKDQPGGLFRAIFKIPKLYYRLGLGWMIEKRFLLLTTRGRRSGKPHSTPLEYVHHAEGDWYRVAPGWGGRTDWYRNLLKDPRVTVQVGMRTFETLASPIPEDETARTLMEVSQRFPRMDRIWQRWCDQPVDGSWEGYLHAARFFPAVRLQPITKE